MSFFDDPRLREERRFLFIVLPILLLIAVVLLLFLLHERKYIAPERAALAEPSATPVPTPPPIPVSLTPADQPVSVTPPSTPAPISSASTPLPSASPQPTAAVQAPPDQRLFAQGIVALGEGRRDEARRLFFQAVTAGEDIAEASNVLGTMEYEEKKWDQALAHFSKAVDGNKGNPIYFLNRSEAFRRLGQYPAAIEDLESARLLAPQDPLYPNKILLTRLESGERDKVFKEVQGAFKLNVSSYRTNSLGAAAAIELAAGNKPQGIGYLLDLREQVTPLIFNIIVTDQCFKPYTDQPGFAKLLPGQPSN